MHAAIDIGTNSIHLIVARATAGGGFDVVTTEKEMVRLGSGGGDMKRLEPDAIDRGIVTLARMAEVAASLGAEVTAVATSAVREAENRDEFVDRAKNEIGVTVDVISGIEEARLIHHGVIHAVPIGDRRALVVDIGGGSTEFIVGEGQELIEARSLRLGAIRMTERFLRPSRGNGDNVPSAKSVKRCRTFLRSALDGVARELGGHQPQLAIGSSGTITAVASMIAAGRGENPNQMNGFVFTRAELAAAVEEILATPPVVRHKIRGLDQRRADIIGGGVVLLEEIFNAFDLESMTLSEYALREGVLFDHFPSGIDHLRDLRRSNALRMARQLDPDVEHARTTARLARQLFDRTSELHNLDDDAGDLLETAAIVHNVGLFIAHSGHHKHAYYIIRNSEQLTGFNEHEIGLIALIARYHRKSKPNPKHDEFERLDDGDKHLVRTLAGLLRIAIGLDRRHAAHITAVGVQVEPATATEADQAAAPAASDDGHARSDRLVIDAIAAPEVDIGVEVYAASERSDLLAEALGLDVVIRARSSSSA